MATQPTPEQLQQMVRVVCKVIGQIPCFHVYEDYIANRFGAGETEISLKAFTHNAALDSALINLRCFNEFFKPNGIKDDVRAYHYPGPTIPPFLEIGDEHAIHKHLAHLTLQRVNLAATPWEVDRMTLLGLQQGVRFLESVETNFPLASLEAKAELVGLREGCNLYISKISRQHTSPENQP
jgi:hypothetical protein